MSDREPAYEIEGRELIAEAPGLRVQVLTLAAGECVPWHRHSEITDTFYCLDGPMTVSTRDPLQQITLQVGESLAVARDRPHRVAGKDEGPCRFLLVQGVGNYDYLPES